MQTWKIDASHSKIEFKVKHLMVSTVSGMFTRFKGEMQCGDADFENAQISFQSDVNSIYTNDEKRDEHLKSEDFFNAGNYPFIRFVSKRMEKTGINFYSLLGDLTIRNNTREIYLEVEHRGTVKGFGFAGAMVTVFTLKGKINRHDFGLSWNALTEAGGLVLGDEVRLYINVELVKQ